MQSVAGLTAVALVAFALNSVLCRLALEPRLIDAGSFTALRLASGAIALVLLLRIRPDTPANVRRPAGGSFVAAFALFAYAAPFSYAYLQLPAGVGALILFGCVQTTMIGWDLLRGGRPRPAEWLGLLLALGGLTALTLPGQSAPPLGASALMAVAGVAWGGYSLLGRDRADALAKTADNFRKSLLLLPLLGPVVFLKSDHALHLTAAGAGLAVCSGAVTSGIGYAIWYRALAGLSATRAALVQLSVPVLAALGGVVLLGEAITVRLLVCSVVILSGVALSIVQPGRAR